MTRYEVTLRYESGLTGNTVREGISVMTGVPVEQIEVEAVESDE